MAGTPQTLDFAPNYCHVIELDITPTEATPTWANALVGITECAPASDETVDEDDYYDNFGMDDTNVSKIKPSLAMAIPCRTSCSQRHSLLAKTVKPITAGLSQMVLSCRASVH